MDIGSRVAGQPAVENDEFVTKGQIKTDTSMLRRLDSSMFYADVDTWNSTVNLTVPNNSDVFYIGIHPAVRVFNWIAKFVGDGSTFQKVYTLYNEGSNDPNKLHTLEFASMSIHIFKKIVDGTRIRYVDVTYNTSVITSFYQELDYANEDYNIIYILFNTPPPTGQEYIIQFIQGGTNYTQI
jgi:hypothetical protein